jgi:hypothetical protein
MNRNTLGTNMRTALYLLIFLMGTGSALAKQNTLLWRSLKLRGGNRPNPIEDAPDLSLSESQP